MKGLVGSLLISLSVLPIYSVMRCLIKETEEPFTVTLPAEKYKIWNIIRIADKLIVECNGVVVLDFQFSDEKCETLNPEWRTWWNQKITYAAFAKDQAPYGDTGSEYFRTTPISGWVKIRYFDVDNSLSYYQ